MDAVTSRARRSSPSLAVSQRARLSTVSRSCPVVASGSARSWPTELPSGGQQFCPAGQLARGVTPLPVVA
jgi:hypothetical protein